MCKWGEGREEISLYLVLIREKRNMCFFNNSIFHPWISIIYTGLDGSVSSLSVAWNVLYMIQRSWV